MAREIPVFAAACMAIIINPIAWPAWILEKIIRARLPEWQFEIGSGAIYLCFLCSASTFGLLYGDRWLMPSSLYVLTAMELLALWISLSIAFVRPSMAFTLLKRFAHRRTTSHTNILLDVRGFLVLVLSYLFTIYYFGAAYFYLQTETHASFHGIAQASVGQQFLDAVYFSAITIATVGFGDIYPTDFISRVLVVLEILLGTAFALFGFGAFVSFHIGQLKDHRANDPNRSN